MLSNFFLFILIAFSSFSFGQRKIQVGLGPEDFVLDTINDKQRLLISCDPRRDDKSYLKTGDIWSYNLNTDSAYPFKRINEPTDISFNPHGVFLLNSINKQYLFVVNHFNQEKKRKSSVIRYTVDQDILIYDTNFNFRSTINSVYAFSKDHFVITNDKKLNGNLYEYKNNQFTKIDSHIKYPNGISKIDSILYISTVISNKVYAYTIQKNGSYSKNKKIAKIKGADNLRYCNGMLLTTSHPKLMKVVKHFKNKEKISPSIVYSIDPKTGKTVKLFEDDGSLISAASTAIIYKDKLYISQIFENFLIEIDLK